MRLAVSVGASLVLLVVIGFLFDRFVWLSLIHISEPTRP